MATARPALQKSPPTGAEQPSQPRIGDLLVRMGALSQDDLAWALAEQAKTGDRLGEVLLRANKVSSEQFANALSQRLRVKRAELASPDPAVADLIDPRSQKRYGAVALRITSENRLQVAMVDPSNILAIDDLRMLSGYEIDPVLVLPEEVAALINRQSEMDEFVADLVEEVDDEVGPSAAPGDIRGAGDEAPVVRLVNSVIVRAVDERASDIHFEPQSNELVVRYRVDGVLRNVASVPLKLARGVTSRIKVMAEMDIAERRKPQDGRIGLNIGGRHLDLRVASLPTVYGESIVIRILDRSNVVLELSDLGFDLDTLDLWQQCYRKPYGAVLVTGPTGSGKSTTLYGTLNQLNTGHRKIITVEDPVEYRLAGVNQVQVNPKAGLTFAAGLRAILRSDPDVVMIGEIRDQETARISMEAALTGHMVLATLHTNDASSAVTRLTEMGIEPFLSASAILGVLAQRLARRVCPHCREREEMPLAIVREMFGDDDLPESLTDPVIVPRAVGCERCGESGYSGRVGVYEMLQMDESIERLVVARASSEDVRRQARLNGMRTLREDALKKVMAGETTLEEVARTVV